jgi:hypothetical protein
MPSGRACACANVKDATNKATVLNCIFAPLRFRFRFRVFARRSGTYQRLAVSGRINPRQRNVKCVKKRATWGKRRGKGVTDVSRTYEGGVKNDDSQTTQNIKSRAVGRKGKHEAICPFLQGNCRSMVRLLMATPVAGTSQVAPDGIRSSLKHSR